MKSPSLKSHIYMWLNAFTKTVATILLLVSNSLQVIMGAMSNKKRRHKVYKGSDAAIRPSVVKVSAVKRNPTHQWYVDHRRVVRVGLIAAAVIIVIILVIIGLIGVITPR